MPQQQPASPAQKAPDSDAASALGTAGYRVRAAQEANRATWQAHQKAMQQPIPDYVVRGASQGPSVADLMTQGQQWVDSIRQPEWWAGLLAYPITERHRSTPYLEAMTDPIFWGGASSERHHPVPPEPHGSRRKGPPR